jgi:mannose-6-phosphate isomerase-like protein (cupin superfamily)
MIVSTTEHPSRSLAGSGIAAGWRCLARRGMLYSECESIDHVRLGPHAVLGPRGREGVESAWFVLDGEGTTSHAGGEAIPVRPGDLVLAPASAEIGLEAGGAGLELLWLAVYPEAVSRALPPRRPAVS